MREKLQKIHDEAQARTKDPTALIAELTALLLEELPEPRRFEEETPLK